MIKVPGSKVPGFLNSKVPRLRVSKFRGARFSSGPRFGGFDAPDD
jgi:hypothetical protein